MSVHCVSAVSVEARRGVSDPLGLEFPTVVNHHADAGIQTHVLWKNNLLLTAEDVHSPQVHNVLLLRQQQVQPTEHSLAHTSSSSRAGLPQASSSSVPDLRNRLCSDQALREEPQEDETLVTAADIINKKTECLFNYKMIFKKFFMRVHVETGSKLASNSQSSRLCLLNSGIISKCTMPKT